VTYFWNFGTPFISRKWLQPETSNLAGRFINRGTNERYAKLGQRGSEMGHVTYFWNFRTPFVSRKRLELETWNLAGRFINRGTNERNAKLSHRVLERGHVTYRVLLKFWDPLHISGTVGPRNVKLGMHIHQQGY